MTIPVRQNLLSPSKYSLKSPYTMIPEYITVHNTYNDASADAEIRYMISNSSAVSFHFAVDGKEVVQGVPIDRNAWHAGDGNGSGNRKSIAVEICYSKSGGPNYSAAENMAIEFIAQLLKERSWGVERLRKHQDWSGKNCPHRILDEGRWQSFVASINSVLNKKTEKLQNTTRQIIQPSMPVPILKKGSRGTEVIKLQKLLGALQADGIFGDKTATRLKGWQKAHGLSADGIFGAKTLAKFVEVFK